MKRNAKLIPVLLTLLLLCVGAALPRMTALALDRRLLGETSQREDDQVSLVLTQDMDFLEALAFFDLGQSQVELAGGRRMTAEEVRAAAADTMVRLSSLGTVYPVPAVTPVLITSRDDPGLCAVYWRCVWTDDAGTREILWLDDGSGLMVALQSRVGVPTVSFVKSPYQEPVLTVAEYCRANYPVDEVKVALEAHGEGSGDYRLTFVKTAEGETSGRTAALRLRGEWIYFNL